MVELQCPVQGCMHITLADASETIACTLLSLPTDNTCWSCTYRPPRT